MAFPQVFVRELLPSLTADERRWGDGVRGGGGQSEQTESDRMAGSGTKKTNILSWPFSLFFRWPTGRQQLPELETETYIPYKECTAEYGQRTYHQTVM